MKNITLTFIAFLFIATTYSQKQTVYSIVKQPQSVDWYKNQFKLWEAETKSDSKNTEAWQNAYIALRMLKINGAGKTQEDLNAFIKKMF